MKNNNVLKDSSLLNPDINRRDCKNCVYNCYNGCPSEQSHCWRCQNKSEFKPVPCLLDLEHTKFGSLSKSSSFVNSFSNLDLIRPLLSIKTDLAIAICFCEDSNTLRPLRRAYESLSLFIESYE